MQKQCPSCFDTETVKRKFYVINLYKEAVHEYQCPNCGWVWLEVVPGDSDAEEKS